MLKKFSRTMKSNYFSLTHALLMLGLLMGFMTSAGVATASAQAHFHVTICHRTGSATNPYIQISPDVEGVVNGHMDHNQIGNGLGGDIIPVFVFEGITYSKNLDFDFGHGVTGAEVLANGCVIPEHHTPTPTPSMSCTPTPTPSPSPSCTPTPPITPSPTPVPVPEPTTILLLGTGLLLGLGAFGLRKLGIGG